MTSKGLVGLVQEMRAEVTSKATGILHEAATNHWADELEPFTAELLALEQWIAHDWHSESRPETCIKCRLQRILHGGSEGQS